MIVVATDAVESILLLFGVSGECVSWASIRPFQKGKRRGREPNSSLKPLKASTGRPSRTKNTVSCDMFNLNVERERLKLFSFTPESSLSLVDVPIKRSMRSSSSTKLLAHIPHRPSPSCCPLARGSRCPLAWASLCPLARGLPLASACTTALLGSHLSLDLKDFGPLCANTAVVADLASELALNHRASRRVPCRLASLSVLATRVAQPPLCLCVPCRLASLSALAARVAQPPAVSVCPVPACLPLRARHARGPAPRCVCVHLHLRSTRPPSPSRAHTRRVRYMHSPAHRRGPRRCEASRVASLFVHASPASASPASASLASASPASASPASLLVHASRSPRVQCTNEFPAGACRAPRTPSAPSAFTLLSTLDVLYLC
ncbi:hypothetical protein BC826DRAFT_1189337 [Russula brevipes]|nr:hypothetical protein BC826DRAFT_1189337 [Russula brevipes]